MIYPPIMQWRKADPEVINGFLRAATKTNASQRIRLALFMAGIVESNLRTNLPNNDLDSLGPLQQRAGWGGAPARLNPEMAAMAFIRDAQRRVIPSHPEYRAARLAQAVQRSAYPLRYRLAYPAARYILSRATKSL